MRMTEALMRMNLFRSMEDNIVDANNLLVKMYIKTMDTDIGKYFYKHGPVILNGSMTVFDEDGYPLESEKLTKEIMISRMLKMDREKMYILVYTLSYFNPYLDFEITEGSTVEEMVEWLTTTHEWDDSEQDWSPKRMANA